MFKVGDRVIYCVSGRLKNKKGTIIYADNRRYVPLVEFDDHVNGHDGLSEYDYKGKQGHCWYCDQENLKLADNFLTRTKKGFI